MQRLLAHAVRQACCASSSSGAAQCPPALLHHLQKNLHQHHQQWGGFSTRSTMQPPSPKAPADITPEQRQGVRACVRACAATATQRGQGVVALLLPLRAIHSQRAYAHVPAAWLPRGGVGAWLTVRVRVHACTPPHTHTRARTSAHHAPQMANKLLYRSKQRGFLELDLLMGLWAEENIPRMDVPTLEHFSVVLDQVGGGWVPHGLGPGLGTPTPTRTACPAALHLHLGPHALRPACTAGEPGHLQVAHRAAAPTPGDDGQPGVPGGAAGARGAQRNGCNPAALRGGRRLPPPCYAHTAWWL